MKIKNYHWVVLCAAVVLTVVLSTGWIFPREAVQKVKIGDDIFLLRVARMEGERERGLGGTPALARDEGMLFEFPTDALHAIWMKDMLIPIDIMWLSDDFLVVDIRKDVSPDTFPEVFVPKSPARFVVELPAGSAEAFGISIGSRAELFVQ